MKCNYTIESKSNSSVIQQYLNSSVKNINLVKKNVSVINNLNMSIFDSKKVNNESKPEIVIINEG